MKPRLSQLVAVTIALSILALIGPVLAQERVLTIGSQNDANTLDPVRLGPVETDVAYKVYSSLVRLVPGTVDEYVGDLATRWDVSDDGLVYTFELQPGAQWHRGFGEVTADDVKYSFERLADPDLASALIEEARLIREIVVLDDHNLEIHLRAPCPTSFSSS
jgi:peptide/nickel transport system substrate-binding protein